VITILNGNLQKGSFTNVKIPLRCASVWSRASALSDFAVLCWFCAHYVHKCILTLGDQKCRFCNYWTQRYRTFSMSCPTHHNMLQKVLLREAIETFEVLCEVTPLRRVLLSCYQSFEGPTTLRLVFSCQSTLPAVPWYENVYQSRCMVLRFHEGYNLYCVTLLGRLDRLGSGALGSFRLSQLQSVEYLKKNISATKN
jgi:hypothetical protein